MTMGLSKRFLLVAGLVVVVGAAAGVAIAAVTLPFSGDGNTINGCYSSGGALKVLTPSNPTCPGGYTPITWNQTGPKGDTGATGVLGFYTRSTNVALPANATNYVNVNVDCDSGDVLTGGGYSTSVAVTGESPLVPTSAPVSASRWLVRFFNGTSIAFTGDAYVRCADITP
jgi:hypothetical protein